MKKLFIKYPLFFLCIFISFDLFSSPLIIAHRGGGKNFPENTILAFEKAIEIGCDGIELDVQVTKDDVIVVYHPLDLSVRTDGQGAISSMDFEEIRKLDAGYKFQPENNFPRRCQGLIIPTLSEVLDLFPQTFIIIDLKSSESEKLLKALACTISGEQAERLIFYSTNSEHIKWLHQNTPHLKTFETRDETRDRLLNMSQKGEIHPPEPFSWVGFELSRKMEVKETFTLGEGGSTIEFRLWTPEVISELKSFTFPPKLVLFGINTLEDWEEAVRLKVDAVYTDDPQVIIYSGFGQTRLSS
ncbi:MAG: hypothetical protein KAR79_05120 [Simkaniaceae bacterium]|nr:hypothetical protein [Simkaniaceae bacterium]